MPDDLILEFIAEASEHLTRAEEILLVFSRQPEQADAEAINACFRAVHTIKGCSGFLDLLRIQRLAHAGEQTLDALRTHDLEASTAAFDALLAVIARLRQQIAQLNGPGTQLPDDDDDCMQLLEAARQARPLQAPEATATSTASPPTPEEAITAALSGLIAAGPDDEPGIAQALDQLAQAMLSGPWHAQARAVMTRMRQSSTGLAGRDAPDRFLALLKQIEELEALQRPQADAGAQPGAASASRSPAVAGEFANEATELLAGVEALVIGRSRFTPEQINSIFRAFHTIKGMAAYLDHPAIEHAAHGVETHIQAVRDGSMPADDVFILQVLRGVDALRALTASSGPAAGPAPAPAAAPAECAIGGAPAAGERIGDVLVGLGVPRTAIEHTAASLKPGERIGDRLVADGTASRQQVEQAAVLQHAGKTAEAFSRVATAKLEELMDQVGELLIAQAMVQHHPELEPQSTLGQAVGRQGRILRQLQLLSLSLRMVPMRGTFQKMARVAYDTAKKLGKQISFVLGGEDTEIDRTLAEALGDPLMHMVRNGIDHGIEKPEARIARGKPPGGTVRLEAFQAGDNVVIRLQDDGAGMDPARLRAKAIEKGLIDASAPMDEQACFQIVFLPGFSTAAAVTDVSGRGVGMDVVRRQVEKANGTVHIASTVGVGTTFTIRLPMTTAILDAMLLKVGAERLLMPISGIIEMLRPRPGQVGTLLESGRMIRHRDCILPLVRLGEVLGVPDGESDPEKSILVVVENRGADFAVQVDTILGQRQVVIKPFEPSITHHPATSGTTILGDGRVALILNPAALVRQNACAAGA